MRTLMVMPYPPVAVVRYVMHPVREALPLGERMHTQIRRDSSLCRCGHLCASHGSVDEVGVFQGIGGGTCGAPARGTGLEGPASLCECRLFRHAEPACSIDWPCPLCELFIPVTERQAGVLISHLGLTW